MITLYLQFSLYLIAVFVQNGESIPCFNLNGQMAPSANGDQTTACAPNPIFQKLRQVKTVLMTLLQKKMGELRIICSTLTSLCSPNGSGGMLTPEQLQQIVAANMVLNPPAAPADEAPAEDAPVE